MRQTAIHTSDLPALLTAEQEVLLGDQIEAGVLATAVLDGQQACPQGAAEEELRQLVELGHRAWEHFILANLRMVIHEARQTARRTELSFDELFQEGCLGLVLALERFDHRQGVRFSTYGLPWVRNAVLQHAVRRGGELEGPVWRSRQAHRLQARLDQLGGELGPSTALAALAVEVGRDEGWIRALLADSRRVSLDVVEYSAVIACPQSERALAACEYSPPAWVRRLGTQEEFVLRLRFGLDGRQERGYQQIASRMGVSVSTVRRLERRGLAQARALLTTEDLSDACAA